MIAPEANTSNKPDDPEINRRVFVRFPCGKATAASLALEESCIFQTARVLDISAGGVALLLWEPLEKGTDVFVQLTNRDQDLTYELPAKVANVTERPSGKWMVGFSFTRTLTPAELASVV